MFAKRGLLGLACVMLLGSTAFGGITTMTCVFPDTGLQGSYVWDDQASTLSLTEVMNAAGSGSVGVLAEADTDPTFTVNKSVNNSTTFDWTSYVVTLTNPGGATFVSGTATSDVFTTAVMNAGLTEITFTNGTVAQGGGVAFSFQINLPDAGSFNFGLNQQAIPEPATMALLVGGAVALLARRRRRTA